MIRLLSTTLLMALASTAAAEETKLESAGAFRVRRPADWSRVEDKEQGTVMYAPEEAEAGSCALMKLPGEESKATPAAWARTTYDKMAEGSVSSKAADPASRGRWAVQGGTITDAAGTKAKVAIYAVRLGKRIEAFAYLGDSSKTFKKYATDVEALLDSATWIGRNEPGSPVKGIVYRHYRSTLMPASAGGGTFWRTTVVHVTLFDDGLACELWPEGGIATADPNVIHENAVNDCFGEWKRDGDTMTVQWHVGRTDVYDVEDGKLVAGRHPLVPVAPVDGLRFSGRYEWMGIEKLSWIEFRDDGTFDGDRVLEMIPHRNGEARPGRGTGTYVIRDFAIELKWDQGGFARTISFDAYGDDPKKADSLGLAGTTFGAK
ncbi:MAG: hypothetical protein AAB074_00725 [Planctomycetota bacterium]